MLQGTNGEKIETFEQLVKAAENHKMVIHGAAKRPFPAAFMLNMNGGRILNLIRCGTFIYIKP
jgi:hypothetical protein